MHAALEVTLDGRSPLRIVRNLGNFGSNSAAILFAFLWTLQVASYLVLGTGKLGTGCSEFLLILDNLLALSCVWLAFRRARGAAGLFWALFFVTLLTLLVPAVILTISTIFDYTLVSSATWRVLYCLYGTPILMILLLPATDRQSGLKLENFLDLFQITIVAGLGFYVFFYLPLQHMLPADALLRNLDLSNLESVFLLAAASVRLQLVRGQARDRLSRLGLFIFACAIVTLIGNWIDGHHWTKISAWWDLGWALPYVSAGLAASSWKPQEDPAILVEQVAFRRFLGKNLVLVGLLVCIHFITDSWQQAGGVIVTNVVVAASLLVFTIRLAFTQFHQQQEIMQRKKAQEELFAANETITGLLEDARVEASAITQISELGSLLQACSSLAEVYKVLPLRMARLFPETSGTLALLNESRDKVASVAAWGTGPPCESSFAVADCWSLCRGCVHSLTASDAPLRCTHLHSEGESVCLPVAAHGETIGVLAIQDDITPAGALDSADHTRRQQLASAICEHIALSISNLNLREALHLQAIHDPLTGLYNRRHMQEFLDREIHRAHRRHRPVAILMLDLDNFKLYNDTFGHAAGDDVLRSVGQTLLKSVRAEDFVCRYGGEEFLAILPECTLQQAAVRANEIRRRIKGSEVGSGRTSPNPVTVSIGVAAFDETADQVRLLLKLADDALYQAKREGRDRIVIARPARPSRSH